MSFDLCIMTVQIVAPHNVKTVVREANVADTTKVKLCLVTPLHHTADERTSYWRCMYSRHHSEERAYRANEDRIVRAFGWVSKVGGIAEGGALYKGIRYGRVVGPHVSGHYVVRLIFVSSRDVGTFADVGFVISANCVQPELVVLTQAEVLQQRCRVIRRV